MGKGVPFREAHHISGSCVALAESRGVALEDLSIEDFKGLSPLIGQDVYAALDYETAVMRRNGQGGTGPDSVERQIEALSAWLEK